jgi:CubicO group peptidase (beta-lactamase class C family)
MKPHFKYLRTILLLTVAIVLTLSIVIFSKEDIYPGVRNKAEELADVLVNKYGVSGIQYALISEGKIVVSGTAGIFDKDNTRVLEKNSLFGIGSTSKMFTTTAVLMLSDQGKINLDDPVVSYIPEFQMADERYKQITVRMLLNHSSGIMGSTFINGFLFNCPNTLTHDNLLSNLATQQLKAAPGEYSVYCNDGFTLAEIVVEKVSGMSFTDYIRQNITEPLNMSNTYTPQDDFDRSRLVRTFVNNEQTPIDTINVIGTGGLYSTAEDLCKFGQIYMSAPGNSTAANLLSEGARLATMQKEYKKGFGPDQKEGLLGYGLGWDSVDAYPYSGYNIQPLIKGGDTLLYHSCLIVIPEYNMAFAAVISGGTSIFGQVMGQELILETLSAEKDIKKIIPPEDIKAPVLSSMPSDETRYMGIYASSEAVMNVVVGNDGKMTISSLSRENVPVEKYLYTSEGLFVNEDGSKKLTFVEEANGKTYIWVRWLINIPGLGQASMSSYNYEKIQPNNIDAATQSSWDERNGNIYYLINENSHSQQYYMPAGMYFEITTNEKLPGYAVNYKIVDKDKAVQDVQIPGMAGRDLSNMEIMNIGGIEYLFMNDMIFISEKAMTDLSTKDNTVITIEENGYSQWYTVNPGDTGKIMTVNMPENASFAVYDTESCIYFSVVNGNQPVVLPENGKVVFLGEKAGDQFTVSIR